MKQKKQYEKPSMKVFEMRQQYRILVGSGGESQAKSRSAAMSVTYDEEDI